MSTLRALLIGLLATAAVTAGVATYLEAPAALAGPLGLVYGVYAWTIAAYPEARLLKLRSVEGDDQMLVSAYLLVSVALFVVVPGLGVGETETLVLYLALFGGTVGLATLGVLLGDRGIIDVESSDWTPRETDEADRPDK